MRTMCTTRVNMHKVVLLQSLLSGLVILIDATESYVHMVCK